MLAGVLAGVVVVAVAHAQDAAAGRQHRAGSRGSSAPSLARPTSPANAPNADGFLQRWLILDPIAVSGQLTDTAVQTAVKTASLPDQFTATPRQGDTVSVGNTKVAWHAVDTIGYNVNLYHFAYALNQPTSNVLFWATTVVNAPRDMSGVRLAIGSNAASNGVM